MILSFSKTIKLAHELNQEEPLQAGVKTVTRRMWKMKTHDLMVKAFESGNRTHQAWTNCSFVKGATRMGLIERLLVTQNNHCCDRLQFLV